MSEESVVLVGGRRNLPQIFVEHENSGQLRFRREGSVASDGPGSAGHQQASAGTTSTSTPANYGIPGSYSTNFHLPMPEEQIAITPPPGLGKKQLEQASADSGYSGWGDTVRKQRPQNTTFNSRSSYTADGSGDSSFWSLISSPVVDFRKKIKGRQSFVDDGPHFNLKIQPHHVLAGIVGTVLLASVGFSLLIGFQHFNLNNDKLNGKQRSIQYGTEKRAENLKKGVVLSEDDITDEAGNMLGGKRAAMQFAHNKVKREAGGDTAAAGSTGTESAKIAGVADSKSGEKTAGDVGSAASAKVASGAAPNSSVKTAAKVEVSEPLPLPEDSEVEKVEAETIPEKNKPLESMSILELTERMKELNLRLMEKNRDGAGVAANRIIEQIDALKARKRVLIGRLQNAEKNSRARRVAQPILMEDDNDYDDDDDEDDYDEERNNVKQQQDAEVKERLEKLSRYEAAVAQINKLSDQLVGPSRGKIAASKTDGTGRAASPKPDSSNAGPKSSRPEAVKNRAASPKVPKEKSVVDVSAEASSSEKPKRARAPKTRFTNPLTGSLTTARPMSKAKKAAKEAQEAKNAAASAAVAAPPPAAAVPAAKLKAEVEEMQQRLKSLKEAVEDRDSPKIGKDERLRKSNVVKEDDEDVMEDENLEDGIEDGEEYPDYPDQPTFRRRSSRSRREASRGSGRSKRRDKAEDEKFRKKARPSATD